MEAVAAGGRNSNAAKKQRKGKSSRKSGASTATSTTTTATPSGSRAGTSYLTTSAKDLVEAIGRYLSDFLGTQRVHAQAQVERRGETSAVSGSSGRSAGEDRSSSTRQLCGRFFPALLLDGGDGSDEQPRYEQQPPLFPGSSKQNLPTPSTSTSTSTSTSKDITNDRAKQNQWRRKGKGKGSTRKKRNSRRGGRGGSRDQERLQGEEHVPTDEDSDGEEKTCAAGGAGDGEVFLSQFRKALLHFEVRQNCNHIFEIMANLGVNTIKAFRGFLSFDEKRISAICLGR